MPTPDERWLNSATDARWLNAAIDARPDAAAAAMIEAYETAPLASRGKPRVVQRTKDMDGEKGKGKNANAHT